VTSEVLAAPQVASGIVVVRTLDGKIFGISADNGRRLWTYDQTVPALTLRGTSTPAIAGETVVCGFDGGRLSALDINSGRLIWETSIATPRGRDDLSRMVDIDAAPVIIENIVYAVTLQGEMAAMTLNTGRVLWNRELSSYAGFAIDADNIYITDDKSVIWAIDRFNGSAIWQQNGLLNRQVTAPASIGGYLAAGDFEGYLHWLDKTTGAFVSRQKISGDRIIAPPVAAGNVLYVYASDGRLSALTYQ
jgi:outer membrane protein assembly factor BamB